MKELVEVLFVAVRSVKNPVRAVRVLAKRLVEVLFVATVLTAVKLVV